MVPHGYRFGFVKPTKYGDRFLIFMSGESPSQYFALNEFGNPANGTISYGIPEGALITMTFHDGHLQGEVLVED